MKLFKRTLSLFLAFMMVFTSVSLLASADLGNDGMTWKMYFKYYREADVATKDADGNYVKDADGNKYLAHTLNNTVVAPPRMLIAFLENNLQADGSIKIPTALQPYMGGKTEIR